jgi:cobalt/nickel transport protein
MKNRGLLIFLGLALVVILVLAVFVSPWASSSPDGLEKKAEEKGFLDKAEETEPVWTRSPVPDYAVPGVENDRVATGLSGLVGVFITLAAALVIGLAAWGLGRLLKKKDAGSGEPSET